MTSDTLFLMSALWLIYGELTSDQRMRLFRQLVSLTFALFGWYSA